MKKYKCYYKKLVFNKITIKKEIVDRKIILMANSKDQAKRFCEYEVGIKPFKIVKVLI